MFFCLHCETSFSNDPIHFPKSYPLSKLCLKPTLKTEPLQSLSLMVISPFTSISQNFLHTSLITNDLNVPVLFSSYSTLDSLRIRSTSCFQHALKSLSLETFEISLVTELGSEDNLIGLTNSDSYFFFLSYCTG